MQSARRACGTWGFTRRDLFPVFGIPYEDPRTLVPDRDRARENSHRPHRPPDSSPAYATPVTLPTSGGPISRYLQLDVGEWRRDATATPPLECRRKFIHRSNAERRTRNECGIRRLLLNGRVSRSPARARGPDEEAEIGGVSRRAAHRSAVVRCRVRLRPAAPQASTAIPETPGTALWLGRDMYESPMVRT